MRVILFTGKGGVGKTTAAAGAALLAARAGVKTLLLSTDPAHSLGDALAVTASLDPAEPVEVEPGLYLAHIDGRRRFERSWAEIASYLTRALGAAGVDDVRAEELTVLPGADEVLALLEVRDQVRSGRWDAVVVDCAPTSETLRLLALPDVLRWYADRVFPVERRVVRALRPVVGRMSGVPLPDDGVVAAVDRLVQELEGVHEVLTDPGTTVRLVLTPEAVVVAEARRTLTALTLHGYRVDGVVANRVFPLGAADAWRAGWVTSQSVRLAEVEQSFAPLPVHRAPFWDSEPVGADALARLAVDTYGGDDPLAGADAPEPMQVERSGHEFVLSIALPFAEHADTDLVRVGDEIVVTVGPSRRVIALPSALRRCQVAGARLVDGRLRVRFEPDPDVWRSW